jgi:hypothetical protein
LGSVDSQAHAHKVEQKTKDEKEAFDKQWASERVRTPSERKLA